MKTGDIPADPFHEHGKRAFRWNTSVLGARFVFASDSRALLDLAREAFDGVPRHRWESRVVLRVDLHLAPDAGARVWTSPPAPRLSSGGGLLMSHVDAENFALVAPHDARAWVQVTAAMLEHRRILRYELLEFAVLTLGARAQQLMPLHGGCVGEHGRGVLLIGASGTGKSMLALQAALAGLEFLAEDSVFVHPATLCATGLSAFVHARPASLGLITDRRKREAFRRAPQIRRRSGVRKLEIDLRATRTRLARTPLRIIAVVVLSSRRAAGAPRLVPLSAARLRRLLRAEQAYAARQPRWPEFERRLLRAGGYLLSRAEPAAGVAALRELLGAEA